MRTLNIEQIREELKKLNKDITVIEEWRSDREGLYIEYAVKCKGVQFAYLVLIENEDFEIDMSQLLHIKNEYNRVIRKSFTPNCLKV